MKVPLFVKAINWVLLIAYAISFVVRHIPLIDALELFELANLLPWLSALIVIRDRSSIWKIWFARISNILFLILITGIVGLMATRHLGIFTASLFFGAGIAPCLMNLYVLFRTIRGDASIVSN